VHLVLIIFSVIAILSAAFSAYTQIVAFCVRSYDWSEFDNWTFKKTSDGYAVMKDSTIFVECS